MSRRTLPLAVAMHTCGVLACRWLAELLWGPGGGDGTALVVFLAFAGNLLALGVLFSRSLLRPYGPAAHARHRWVTTEQIGHVLMQRCGCGEARTRIH